MEGRKAVPLLSTKFRIHPVRANAVTRRELMDRLDCGLDRKLTLISAPAGFGKSTLAGEWAKRLSRISETTARGNRLAWLSLEESENDYIHFLDYFIGALRATETARKPEGDYLRWTTEPLRTPHPMPEQVLVPLINKIASLRAKIIFVLDDYDTIDSDTVHDSVAFLIDHMPPNMHMVIVTRYDPPLSLARLRSQDEMAELRAADLRFTLPEVAQFMTRTMELELSTEEIVTLEERTEGWPAGLQLAAMSLQGQDNTTEIIEAFAGTHRHVTDYLVEEVLRRQSRHLRRFLLQTSILERMCGPLCDAVTGETNGTDALVKLERTNSFIVALDERRQWYRYHELFRDLLKGQLLLNAAGAHHGSRIEIDELHQRASRWYEKNGMEMEAFQHAAGAHDLDRAERLLHGRGMPLHFRGAAPTVIDWLKSLPRSVLDARPSLWVAYASASIFVGKSGHVEEKLKAAEAALADNSSDETIDDTKGRIAAIRAMLAVPQNKVDTIVAQSRRALKYLRLDNLAARAVSQWALGVALQFQGDRVAAATAFSDVVANSRASGNTFFAIAASTQLGRIQEADNRLHLAQKTYRRVLDTIGDSILPLACEAHLGLARICYEWNDLDGAHQHGKKCIQIARWVEGVDTPAACWVFSARLRLAGGDTVGAASILREAEDFVNRYHYVHRMAEVASAQVRMLLSQGRLEAAARVSFQNDIPLARVRVYLALGDTAAALALLESFQRRAEMKGWEDLLLKAHVLKALAFDSANRRAAAIESLEQALLLAAPEGFLRMFIDEGPHMARLLYVAIRRGIMEEYTHRLLSEWPQSDGGSELPTQKPRPQQELLESLSKREIEVLELIAQGCSNEEVGTRLFISLHTVKAHTRNIYAKLGAHNRTEAVARARSFSLFPRG